MKHRCPRCGYDLETVPPPYEYKGYLRSRLPMILDALRRGEKLSKIAHELHAIGVHTPWGDTMDASAISVNLGRIRKMYKIDARPPPIDNSRRDGEIISARFVGDTLKTIAARHGLSAGRVADIVDKEERYIRKMGSWQYAWELR